MVSSYKDMRYGHGIMVLFALFGVNYKIFHKVLLFIRNITFSYHAGSYLNALILS